MRVFIVEDETAALENLKKILGEMDCAVEIAGSAEGITQTVKWLQANRAPDLIFMDIHLSDGSAFNIFNAVTIETPIIFTTAYDEYAIEAFKVNSIDYILKPIEKKQVQRAIDKFQKLNGQGVTKYTDTLSLLASPGKLPERILVPLSDRLMPVSLNEISYFYATENHTHLMLKNGKKYAYGKTLENICNMLDPNNFFRANKQFIVAKSSVGDISIRPDNRLLITLDIETPERVYVSKNKAALFKSWMTS